MAAKHARATSCAKRSQLASFSIQDILRMSATDSHGFRAQGAAVVGQEKCRDGSLKTKGEKMAKLGSSSKDRIPETGKRIRTIFTQEQLDKLEASFECQQYMIRSERSQLAAALNLQEAQVKVWFQNRRIKWRKQQHETTMAKIRAYQEAAVVSDTAK